MITKKYFNVSGIYVLMTQTAKLMVIKINAQGDLIYQDIFNKDKIYKLQVIEMINEYE